MTPPDNVLASALQSLIACIGLRNADRPEEALAKLDDIPDGVRKLPPFLIERASILAGLSRFEESLTDCRTLCETAPAAEHRSFRDELRERAVRHFSTLLQATPDDPDSLLRRGNVHLLSGDHEDAIADYSALLRGEPGHPDARCNRACALVALNRLDEAQEDYERLLERNPGDPSQWYNYGNVLQAKNRLFSAVDAYQRAVGLRPEFAEAQLEIAHCLLASGRFSGGWRQFEWRWRTAQLQPHHLHSAKPSCLGQIGFEGKAVLLWAEQGFGDTLQFTRFIPRVADRAASVVLRAPASLHSLLRTVDERIALIDDASPLPEHDCHCPLMSLPLALGLSVPEPLPAYLRSPPGRRDRWSDWLGARRARRIGIVWAGRQYGRTNPTRDIPLAALEPLLRYDAEFVCLHKDVSAIDITTLDRIAPTHPVRQPGPELTDFGDTAALIEQLDLVISVDSAVAHLAGALGKPCWLLLRRSGEWRWQLERDNSPWYPSLRLFRQRRPGAWNEVVNNVVHQLDHFRPPDPA